MDALIAGYCQYSITFIVLGVAILLIALDVYYSRLDHPKPKPITSLQRIAAWQYATMFQTCWAIRTIRGTAMLQADLDDIQKSLAHIQKEVAIAFDGTDWEEAVIIHRTIEWCNCKLEILV